MTRKMRDSTTPPDGQPYAAPMIKTIKRKSGRNEPVFRYPHKILHIHSKAELIVSLRHYSHPAPKLTESSIHVKTRAGLRHMIELVFPTLRWYCKVFGHEVPTWLEGNGWASDLSEKEHRKYFGKEPLHVREFRERKGTEGKRA